MEKLILIGAGGYAKSVIDSIDYFNYELVGFVDEYTNENRHLDIPILAASIDELKILRNMFILLLSEIIKIEKDGMTH